jgi:hypothetical protein
MNKIVIVIYADTETHESLGRAVNALEFAKELDEQNQEVAIIFDGAGTKWIPKLEDENHDAHSLYEAVKTNIDGACKFCSKAFGVINEVRDSNISLLDDYDGHPSLAGYVSDGYQMVPF